jgi:hypothetical protein
MSKYYLIYQITNKTNGMIYIGCHVTDNPNDGYMGSGTQLNEAIKKEGKENFEKKILQYCDSEEEMLNKERALVDEKFIARDDTYNVILGGNQFLTTDTVTVKDKDDNCFNIHKDDERYLNGELESVMKNKVPVKDKDGNTFAVNKDDERYLSGELKSVSKNKIPVKDKNGNTFTVYKNDYRYLNGELTHIVKNTVIVKDKDGNIFQVDKDDERYLNGELIPFWTNKKHTDETKKLIGSKNSQHQKGSGNSQYGKMWIYNTETHESKKIDKNEPIPNGWKKGRKMK